MLRRFAGPRRRPDEDYIPWLRRATHAAERCRDEAGIKSWNTYASYRKWTWAGHVARMDNHRWAHRMTRWRDEIWWSTQDHRSTGRPMRCRPGYFSRWEKELCKYLETFSTSDWKTFSSTVSTAGWNAHGSKFASCVNKSLGTRNT